MAVAPIEFQAGLAGLGTLTITLYPIGSEVAATAPINLTEAANRVGVYTGTTTAGLVGIHTVEIYSGAEFLSTRYVVMSDDVTIHTLFDEYNSNSPTEDTLLNILNRLNFVETNINTDIVVNGGLLQEGGCMNILPGDDYYTVDGRDAVWTLTGTSPDISGSLVEFIVFSGRPGYNPVLVVTGSVVVGSGSARSVKVQISSTNTLTLVQGKTYSYEIHITLLNGHEFTPIIGEDKLTVGLCAAVV